ncbi:CDP-alcohol phosphatidyltransferase family protein [Streptomyces actinomycinicus]|uniref:CDP-alcohol phosphatidyltransferase family protein n=1 Tax=Streptomyces actinomycinicus TaxID=1695166 RepID=A0A937EII5_9ACTN|nr:CDP-alcohol phosphatidyltransferase family protein [Streptomyces actinomycinicus]MBL1083027.1 CDP-alcohol phosphatidyltransferase family protein [Streptomyces actinomycinicus]
MLSAVQKPPAGVSLYSRFVNRPAGRVLAAVAYRIGATPNQVTCLSALFTFPALAAVALVPPGPGTSVCVCVALAVGFALDAADGQLARGRRSGSPAGEWLDHALDCVKLLGVHAAVLVAFYRFFRLPSPVLLLAPLVFQLAAVLIFFVTVLTEKLDQGGRATVARRCPAVRSVLLLPVDYGTTCLGFLFLSRQGLFLGVYCTLLAAHVLFLPGFLVRSFRRLC